MKRWVKRKIETGLRGFLHAEGEYGVLRLHFFRRFFDNDTISPYGDAATSAAQGVMLAVWPSICIALIVIVGGLFAPLPIGNIHDYFFVNYSFVGMGLLAVFEWHMLFPDKLDFLILTPLPVQPRTLLAAKAESVAWFLGMFLLGANLLGIAIEPVILGHNLLIVIFAHAVSVLLAGSFGASLVIAIGGVLLCVLGPPLLRRVLPVVQVLIVAVLVWLFAQVRLLSIAFSLPTHSPPEFAYWLPPLWFMGIYDRVVMGSNAPQHIRELSRVGFYAWSGAMVGVALVYPLAWCRMQRLTIEGQTKSGRRRMEFLGWIGAHRPEERAVFGFVGQTLRRNQRYQNYLTMYGGAGLAIAAICVVSVRFRGQFGLDVSESGMRAAMPLLLFWSIAGLRAAFDIPVDLGAGWVFAISGVELGRCAASARRWATLQGMLLVGIVLSVLAMAHWIRRSLMVQAVLGVSLAMVLADVIFALHRGIPFTRPRLPGKTNVAISVGIYGVAMPYGTMQILEFERSMERSPIWLIAPVAIAIALRLALREVQRREGLVYELRDEELEGTLTLGLDQ